MRPLLMFTVAALLSASTPFETQQQKWRQDYQARLLAPTGWAAVAGLFWLHEGENRVGSGPSNDVVLPKSAPASAGTIRLHEGHVSVALPGKSGDVKLDQEKFALGRLALMAIKRGTRYGIRLWDPDADTVRHFRGLHWYPVDAAARIEARWIPYEHPKQIPIVSVLGYTEMNTAPGVAEFQWKGKLYRVEPVIEEDHLFLMFKDPTSRHETYPSGRFLTVAMPRDGKVILDFNQARNPPCAFTSFATCPIPPKQNFLDQPVLAGEKRYGHP